MRVLLPIVLLLAGRMASAELRAGAGRVDVTPEKFPVISNCQMLERVVTQLTNRLYARSIVLGDGPMRMAITVVDSCMMPRELLDRAKAIASRSTGIPVERMLISATHTHTAPAAMSCLGSDVQSDYAEWLPGKIAESMELAAKNLVPAQIGWAAEEDWEHTHSRRWIYRPDKMLKDPFGVVSVRANMHPGYQNPNAITPAGPVDPALTVLSVQTREGKPLAVLANYSQHYFGDAGLSPDYYGLFASKLAGAIGGDENFVGMMSQGTSGDQMWMDYSQPKSSIKLDAYAQGVVDSALKAYRRIEYSPDLPLGMAETKIRFRRRLADEERLAWSRGVVAKMGDRKPKSTEEVYAREQLLIAKEPEREMKLQAIRIGDFAIHAIPNEVFALSGLKLKLRSPFRTVMNVELANGAEGYIPPPEQHRLGGYTTWAARTASLDPGAEPRIVEELLTLDERLAGKPRRVPEEKRGAYAEAVFASGPAAWWRFREMDGERVFDEAGSARLAKHEGLFALFVDGPASPAFSLGQRNPAAYLAGGRFVAEAKEMAGDFTVEFWFWNGMPAGEQEPNAVLLALGERKLVLEHSGRLALGVMRGRESVPEKKWQHLVMVRRGDRVQVYRNGAAEFSGELRLPAMNQLAIGGPFEGKIDEVALFARPLTAVEILGHFSAVESVQ